MTEKEHNVLICTSKHLNLLMPYMPFCNGNLVFVSDIYIYKYITIWCRKDTVPLSHSHRIFIEALGKFVLGKFFYWTVVKKIGTLYHMTTFSFGNHILPGQVSFLFTGCSSLFATCFSILRDLSFNVTSLCVRSTMPLKSWRNGVWKYAFICVHLS